MIAQSVSAQATEVDVDSWGRGGSIKGEDTGAAVKMIKYICEYETSWMVEFNLTRQRVVK